jgi:hypothetical protein
MMTGYLRKISLAAAAVLATGGCLAGGTVAKGPSRSGDIVEINLTNSPDRTNGQPVIAVHPQRPANLVAVSTAHSTDGGTLTRLACAVSYSQDGGLTWQQVPWPYGDRPYCGDPYLAVDSRGTFFIAFNRLGCPSNPDAPLSTRCAEGPGNVGVSRSSDGGRTWSVPVDTSVARATTPRLRVDRATDAVVVAGGVGAPSPHAITISTDHGLTWTPIAPLPAQPFGNQIAVHDGLVATATALKVVGEDVVPAEVRFWVSADGGRTFTSSPVTDGKGAPALLPSGRSMPNNKTLAASDPVPWITADPSRKGRFAVMLPHGEDLLVYVTGDSGKQWSGPAVIPAPDAAKPWIEFGANGDLGVVWRTLTGDVSNVFATVSFDGGRSFGAPVKVNAASHPYGYPGSGGDEWSRILLEGDQAFVTWADARSGGKIDAIMARVPLSLFRRPRP